MNLDTLFSLTVIFFFGVCIGSFLNVVIDRFATNRSIIKGRSYCEFCKKTLEAKDLIPILSYIWLKGRCRFCKKRIPVRLLIVELMVGVLAVSLFNLFGATSPLLFAVIFISSLIFMAIFFVDLQYGIIPDRLSIILTILSIIYVLVSDVDILRHIYAGIGSLIFFIGLFLVTRGKGMGLGDVKISFSLGMFLGFPFVVYGLYLAFLTGAIVSIILVLWNKKKFRGGTIPFGPFLTASTLFTLLFGEKIIEPIIKTLF